MLQPLVIKFLQTHSLQELYDLHGVKCQFDKQLTKINLNYDQIAFTPGNLLAEQCRGLIVRPTKFPQTLHDIVEDVQVIAWPMTKFYNQGEFHAANIDLTTVVTREKLDGTMLVLYWDEVKNFWCVGTRGTTEADVLLKMGDLIISDKTFFDLFLDAIMNYCETTYTTYEQFISQFSKHITYVFELTSPHNKIVVDYAETNITLIAARDLLTGDELNIDDLQLNCYTPKKYNLQNVSQIAEFANTFAPVELEGFVLCDANFNRIKIKNLKWVFASREKENVSTSKRRALEYCLKREIDDIIPFLSIPVAEKLQELNSKLKTLIHISQQQYELINSQCGPQEYKKFALLLTQYNSPFESAMFAMKRGQASSIIDYIDKLIINNKLRDSFLDLILKFINV